MIAACDVTQGDFIDVKLSCKDGEDGRMTIRAAILDDSLFRRGWEVLNRSTLQITEYDTTRICGIVEADREGLLYTSIPQDGGWSVTLDGEEAETLLVGDVMTAVKLTEGSHDIEITYRNAAFDLGWKISAICLLLFGLTAPIYYSKRKKGRFEK